MTKTGVLVDLRPNRDLLNPNFDGYKLSLDSVPVYQKTFETGVDYVLPADDQYSFFHAKLFSLHNHLFRNEHSKENVYFIDKKWKVLKVLLNPLKHLNRIEEVCVIPNIHERQKGHYNCSVSFPSASLAVISNGAGFLHVAEIVSEGEDEKWKIFFSEPIFNNDTSVVVCDSRLEKVDQVQCLHIILMRIEEKNSDKDKEKEEKGSSFQTVLEWITIQENCSNIWTKKSHKTLHCDGNIDYVAIEQSCESLLVVSEKIPKWVHDSENPIVEVANDEKLKDETVNKIYKWSQTKEEISVSLSLPEGSLKSDLKFSFDDMKVTISVKDEIIVSGNLYHRIDKDLTTWACENNKLELHLVKYEAGLIWNELIVGDEKGEEIVNGDLAEETHARMAHLCSDQIIDGGQPTLNSLEECDAAPSDTVFVRLSSTHHKVTHEISLSSFQWLFKVHCDPKMSPALCLRHDVDGCVWQFSTPEENSLEWPYKHIGTFFALGYVQASKTQKKFLLCPPDLSYAALCETSRHVYLYRQPSAINSELRNRTSGRKVEAVSKQQLVTLETNELILGAHATDSVLYILTEKTIYVYLVNP